MESEPAVGLADYHTPRRPLFVAAATMGALAVGGDGQPWAEVGERLGLAYQLADDLLDEGGDRQAIGKLAGRDAALGRPSARHQLGARECRRALDEMIEGAAQAVPPCAGREALRAWLRERVGRLLASRGLPAQAQPFEELRGETGT
ncbi:MAG: polyprenyl synthetase family protein [Polyangiaceae bacterium]